MNDEGGLRTQSGELCGYELCATEELEKAECRNRAPAKRTIAIGRAHYITRRPVTPRK